MWPEDLSASTAADWALPLCFPADCPSPADRSSGCGAPATAIPYHTPTCCRAKYDAAAAAGGRDTPDFGPETLHWSSRRGDGTAGRIKPDLIAPGEFCLDGRLGVMGGEVVADEKTGENLRLCSSTSTDTYSESGGSSAAVVETEFDDK